MATLPLAPSAHVPPTAADPRVAGPGPAFGELAPCPHPLRHPLRAAAWLVSLGAGLVSLLLILSILAALPVANFLALGYMLDGEGRVVRSGRLRDGVPLLGGLPRLGAVVFGTWAWLLLVRLVTSIAADAALIDPHGPAAARWRIARIAMTVLVGLHLLLAWRAGGSLMAFVRPIHNLRSMIGAWRAGHLWSGAAGTLAGVLAAIRPVRLFLLGLGGFVGGFLWLLVPTLLFAALRDTQHPAAVLVTLTGGLALTVVLAWVPVFQARFAASERPAAFREVAATRELFRRAPVVLTAATVLLHSLSLPLHLFKVIAAPQDAVLLMTPIFILSIFPARLALGWAVAYAQRRTKPRWLVVRFASAIALTGLLGAYLFLLFFTPAIEAFGRRTLMDHHAILLPTPF